MLKIALTLFVMGSLAWCGNAEAKGKAGVSGECVEVPIPSDRLTGWRDAR